MGRGPHTVPLRALLRHAGVGSPRGRDPRGSRSSRISPPRVAVPSGEGGRPLGSGGAEGRSCCSLAGGLRGGGWGILVPWGLPGGRGRRARSVRPPTGQCGGGGGGGTLPPWFAPPSSPGRPLIRPLRLRRPGRRRSAAGWQQQGVWAPASAVVPPHPGCSGLFGGGVGPPFLRSASVRSWP